MTLFLVVKTRKNLKDAQLNWPQIWLILGCKKIHNKSVRFYWSIKSAALAVIMTSGRVKKSVSHVHGLKQTQKSRDKKQFTL